MYVKREPLKSYINTDDKLVLCVLCELIIPW